jgi:hypothetical protein
MFLFFLGHFSLNAVFDKEADSNNPRKSEFSSWNDSSGITVKMILIVIGIVWTSSIIGSIFYMLYFNSLLIPFFIFLAILLSVTYSVPPLQAKGRAPWDLIVDQVSFGILGPLFALESFVGIYSVSLFDVILLLSISISTLSIVVLPTIMMDTTIDRFYGYNTFSVRFGMKNTLKAIGFFLLIQILSLSIIAGISLVSGGLFFVIVIGLFLYTEIGMILPLWFNSSERNANQVVKFLTFSFLQGGTTLLIVVNVTRFFGFPII